MSTSTDNRPSFYITLGQERRAIALATGLRLGSQRIEHWIWFNRLLIQGKGIAAITSADAAHELGMTRNQWDGFSRWIRKEGWAQIEKAYGQGFIWSHGQRWHQIDWPILNAQAEAEHLASREPLKRRATVKQAAIGRNGSSGGKSTNGESTSIALKPGMEPSSHCAETRNGSTAHCPETRNGIDLHCAETRNGIPETDATATDLSPLKPLISQTSLRAQTSFGSQTSGSEAEVEQQASALAGSSPAEVPEQPEQPGAGQGSGDGAGLDLAGSGHESINTQPSVIEQLKAASIQQWKEYRAKQKQSPDTNQNQPDTNQILNESDCVESQPKAEPVAAWAGLPVESLVDGDVLINQDGCCGVVELWGDGPVIRVEDEWNSSVGPITDVDGLRGWSMVATAPTAATLEQQHPDSTAMVIAPGTVFTVDDSLSQFITVAADWSDDPSLDTVLAHPVDDPSSLQRFKANVVSIVK